MLNIIRKKERGLKRKGGSYEPRKEGKRKGMGDGQKERESMRVKEWIKKKVK